MALSIVNTNTLPKEADKNSVYILEPVSRSESYYNERTNRNIGWISEEEQQMLKNMTVGVAGCGGMGGMVTQILVRVGIGTIKIADLDNFDVSNLNRQAAATHSTLGQNKAFATANLLRETAEDVSIHVYPYGISEDTVDSFIEECDLIIDSIEFWGLAGRILLHQKARDKDIHIINGVPVGFGTRLFLFNKNSASIEKCLGFSYEEAKEFEVKKNNNTATVKDKIRIMSAVTLGLIPEGVDYTKLDQPCGNFKVVLGRLLKEAVGSVISTNPPMAGGFLANHVVLHLLRNSPIKRNIVKLPLAPGYLFLDAAKMKAYVRKPNAIRHWWHHQKIKMIEKLALRAYKKHGAAI